VTIEAVPTPPSPPPSAGSQVGGATLPNQRNGDPRKPGGDDRIHELIRKHAKAEAEWEQKERAYQDRLEEQDSRIGALEQRFQKEPMRAETGGEDSFRSWTDVPEEKLSKVLRAGAGENPDLWAMALEERLRRVQEQSQAAALKTQQDLDRHRQSTARSWHELKRDFGEELDDPASELRQRAEAVMADKRQRAKREGRPDPLGNPDVEEACVARAYRELHAKDLTELEDLRRRNEELKRMEALQSGARAAQAQIDDNAKKLLGEGKIRESLMSLPQIQSLRNR